MKINEQELETLIEYGFNTLLKPYSISLSDIQLKIEDKILGKGILEYKDKSYNITTSFLIDYKYNQLRIYDIKGYVSYMKLNIPIIQLLKTFNHINMINNDIIYECNIPVKVIKIEENSLIVKIC